MSKMFVFYIYFCTGDYPLYKISGGVEDSYVSRDCPASTCEIYFTAEDKSMKIYLRFTDLLLSPGDVITIDDTKDGKTLGSYSERNSPPVHVTSEGHAVRVFFTTVTTVGTLKSRFALFHQASGKCVPIGK